MSVKLNIKTYQVVAPNWFQIDGTWHHCTVINEGGQLKHYLDGKFTHSFPASLADGLIGWWKFNDSQSKPKQMPKFKKGDRVKCIARNLPYIPIDSIGTIDEDGSLSPWVVWDHIPEDQSGKRVAIGEDYMELLPLSYTPSDIYWPMRIRCRDAYLRQVTDTGNGRWIAHYPGETGGLMSGFYDDNLLRTSREFSGSDIMAIIDPSGSVLWEREEEAKWMFNMLKLGGEVCNYLQTISAEKAERIRKIIDE